MDSRSDSPGGYLKWHCNGTGCAIIRASGGRGTGWQEGMMRISARSVSFREMLWGGFCAPTLLMLLVATSTILELMMHKKKLKFPANTKPYKELDAMRR
jgi:hypothetical protein